MSGNLLSLDDQIRDVSGKRRHLVLLGAGASLASCPNGDEFGKRLPLMHDLVNVTGLKELLERNRIDYIDQNFESLYSRLHENPNNQLLCLEINRKLQEYFRTLVLPRHPTIYDYLILSLREKDVIATFNWDPFLWMAWERNLCVSKGPQLLFLHGCANLGYCEEHSTQGILGGRCHECGKKREPIPLMYPVGKKRYFEHFYIEKQWKALRSFLEGAFLLSIFGYSAPTTDVEALELIRRGWGASDINTLAEIEIIDKPGCDEDELRERWDDLIHSHHYQVCDDFFKSMLGRSPRRTVEVQFKRLFENHVYFENWPLRDCTLRQLQDWHSALVEAERD